MPDTQQLWMFVVAGVLLNLTPGPDVLFIVSQSLRGGVRAGVVAAWGITAGCFVHLAAAALGVGALLATSAAAFNAIKWLGAAYLMWIGVRLLWTTVKPAAMAWGPGGAWPAQDAREKSPLPHRLRWVFLKAFTTNTLNPKVALFFWPLCPNSSRPTRPNPLGLSWGSGACSLSMAC